jgi:autotransporter translocation and assembly factor TamB
MKKWLKKLGKIVGVIAALLVLLVLVSLLFLQTSPGKNFLKSRLVSSLQGTLTGELDVGRIEGGLIGGVELYGVVVRDARGNVALRIPRASADYELLQLLDNELRLESVTVDRPLVVGRMYEDGTLNLSTLVRDQPQPRQPPSQFQISVNEAIVDDGLLVWVNHQQIQTNLSEQRISKASVNALEEWLGALDRPEATNDELQTGIADILATTPPPEEPGGPLTVAALGDFSLGASFHTYGGSKMSGQLETLSAKAWSDATREPEELVLENLSFQRSAAHLEATLDALRLGSFASISQLTAGVNFSTETDDLGNEVVVGVDEFVAGVDQVQVEDVFVHLVAPDAPITGRVAASASVGGTLEDFVYLVRAECGDAGSTPGQVTVAGTASFPGQSTGPSSSGQAMSGLTYDVAALFEQLQPARCVDTGGTEANLSGALLAAGKGANPKTLQANAQLAIDDTQVDGYRIDALYLDASAQDGTFRVDTLEALTPYAQAQLEARFGLDGEYNVSLEIDANDQIRQLAEQLGQRQLTTEFAQVRVASQGKLDLDANSPLGYVERGQLSADWRLRDFRLGDSRIGASRGDVFVEVAPTSGPNARSIEFNADIQGQNIDLPQLSAQRLSVDAQGQGIVEVPVENFLQALRRLSSTWDVQVRQLRTPAAQVDRADIRANIDRGGPGRPFSWDVDGTLRNAQAGSNRVGQADVDLEGTAALRQTDQGIELGAVSAKGAADVAGLEAGQNRVGQGRVQVDVSGDIPKLRGNIKLNATDVEAAGESFESIDADVQLEEDRQFEVSAQAKRGAEKAPISLDAAGKVGADFREFKFQRFTLEAPDMQLTLPEGARVKLNDDGVTFDKIRLQGDGQSISIEGTYRSKGRQDLRVDLDDVRIGEIRERFDLQEMIPPVKASVSGQVSLDGTARRPIIAIEVHLRDIYYNEHGPFALDLIAAYKNQRLRIDELEATAYETKVLVASGQMPLDLNLAGDISVPRTSEIDMQVRIPRVAIQDFYDPLPALAQVGDVSGVVFANLHVGGTVQNPRLKLQFEAQDFAFAGEVGGQQLEIEQVSTALKIDYSPPSGGQGGIAGRYRLSWRGERLVEANISTPMPLADWIRRVLDDEAAPPDWSSALAQLPFDLGMELNDLQLGKVPLKAFAEADAEGTVSLNLEGSGTFSSPRLDFKLNLDDVGWNQYRDIFVSTGLRLRNQMVHIDELRMKWDSQELIAASGKFPLPVDAIMNGQPLTDLPINLTVQLNRMPVSKLSAIDYSFAAYKGSLAAYASVSGTLSSPEIEGRAGLFNTELSAGQNGSVALSFSAQNGQVTADAFVCRSYEKILRATARLPITTNILALSEGASMLGEGEIFAEVSSEKLRIDQLIPATLLGEAIADPEGVIELDAKIEGTLEQPRFSGKVLVENGAVTIPYYARRFTDIDLNIEATRERVVLETLSVSEGESWVRAEGTVDLKGLRPTSLDAEVRSKEFNFGGFAEGFAAYVTSTIELSGDLDGDVREIRAHATDLEVSVPEGESGNLYATSLNNEIVVLQRQTDSDGVLDLDSMLAQPQDEQGSQQTPTHIRFIADRGSWVRHPIADVEFTADFTTMLNGEQLSMIGSVSTVRGNASILGKDFDIPEDQNAVRFTGASPPNPALDIEALHYLDRSLTDDIGEPAEGRPRIIVKIRGRADSPELMLESDPAMTETEVIYVLMTGRAPNQAAAGDESRISGLAVGAASGLFGGLLKERLGGALPLDVVRLKPGEEGFSDARVEVGKYITEDIFVSYIIRLGAEEGEGINVISVDYRFAPSWSLEFQTSDALTGGVNIFWDVY